ncbi:MAG: NAD-dependent epimerase/dehydratase family protein [Pseudomonadales bacterium]|nr:NAD-dependent epimerase/dehydratase family protein [Pseudomonadales bacterium]
MPQRVFVAGHKGMVGSAVLRRLSDEPGYDTVVADRAEFDLTSPNQVSKFFAQEQLDWVVVAAARVGGIVANSTYPADFIYDNLMIEANLIKGAHDAGIDRVLFLGSSCIYPKLATQPIKESELLNGALEPTNDAYAIAKIAGIKLCEAFNRQYGRDYRSLMPTNLYGVNDNFHPENSHVLPALLRRFHDAKERGEHEVVVWGTGTPMREFLFVDDLADAIYVAMGRSKEEYWLKLDAHESHLNVGTGVDVTIKELANIIKRTVGYQGEIVFDDTKPDGMQRKLLDVSRFNKMGWSASTPLEDGLAKTYAWFLSTKGEIRS